MKAPVWSSTAAVIECGPTWRRQYKAAGLVMMMMNERNHSTSENVIDIH